MVITRFFLYTGLSVASSVGLKLGGFLLFLWMARSLPVERYAHFGLLYALQVAWGTFTLAGIQEAVAFLGRGRHSLQELDDLDKRGVVAFWVISATYALIGTAGLLVSATIFGWKNFNSTELISCSVCGIAQAFCALKSQLLLLRDRHLASWSIGFVVPATILGGGWLGFAAENSVESYFFSAALGATAGLLTLSFFGTRTPIQKRRVVWRGTNAILALVPPFCALAVLGWLSGYGNNYVVGILFGAREIAHFTFLLSVSAAMNFFINPVSSFWAAKFYSLTPRVSAQALERMNRMLFLGLGIAIGIAIAVLTYSFEAATERIGAGLLSYRHLKVELFLMCAGYLFLIPYWYCANYFVYYGRGVQLLRLNVWATLIGFTCWIALMYLLGAIGIYAGFLVQMFIRSAGVFQTARKTWGLRVPWEGVASGGAIAFLALCLTAGGMRPGS